MQSSASALFYLRLTTLRNLLAMRIKRLKQPKYLFGAIMGITYFYWVFARRFVMRAHSQPFAADALSAQPLAQYYSMHVTIAALLFTVFMLFYWIWPRARAALSFSEAEIAFLFPAPISRSALIHYRMISLMLMNLLSALIFMLLSSGSAFLPGNALMRFTGWWIVLMTVGLHSMASSFVITRLFDRGITSARRQWSVLLAVAVVVVVLGAAWSRHALPPLHVDNPPDLKQLWQQVIDIFNTAPLSWLLFPAKLVVAPALAGTLSAYAFALLPAILMVALHYCWVLRNEVSFEEASIVKAEKRATQIAAMRSGKSRLGRAPTARKPPFELAAVRRPELAFLWKNLLSTAPYLRAKTAWVSLLIIVAVSLWVTHGQHIALRQIMGVMATVFLCYSLLFGPLLARQDLRSDLNNADILKTYPLQGWQVVLGEILTPAVVVSCIFGLLLVAASLCFNVAHFKWMTPAIHWGGTVAAGIIGMQLCVIQILVLNAAAILFPAWMRINQSGPGGIEVMGQRLLFVAGLLLIFVVALLPALLFAALIYFLVHWFMSVVLAIALAVSVIIAILVVEIVFGLQWLGEKFEHFDLSAELRS